MKLHNTVGKKITALTGSEEKLLTEKAGYFLGKSKTIYIYNLKKPNHINKMFSLLPEIGVLICTSS